MAHKAMIQELLQVRASLILCFRAEQKVKMEKDPAGKTIIVDAGFQPICSKELPFELTVSFLMTPDRPGVGQPLKLQEQHRAIFPTGQQIDENAGRRVAEWASGGAPRVTPAAATPEALAILAGQLVKMGITDPTDRAAYVKENAAGKMVKDLTADDVVNLTALANYELDKLTSEGGAE